jgi:hypothetical protein
MYKQQIILFPAGASGNFLANFLIVDKKLLKPSFRIDWNQGNPNIIFIGNSSTVDRRIVKFDSTQVLEDIHKVIEQQTHQVILSHFLAVSQLKNISEHTWVRKIYPKTNLFGLIKNVNFKKQMLESVDYTNIDFAAKVDQAFIIIDNQYRTIKQDCDCPNEFIIDFGMLYNEDYLVELFESVHGYPADHLKIEWAKNYIDQQFLKCDDCDYKDMQQIIDHVQPKDFFDVAATLFMYEKNHNTIDSNRLWSIDDLPNNINGALEFLKANSKKYTIFQ